MPIAVSILLAATAADADPCGPLGAFASEGKVPALLGEPDKCSTSIAIGGAQSMDCHWAFDFRDMAARAAYAELTGLLGACADGALEVQAAHVNHPDSFDQVLAVVAGHSVSLSLKDKAVMGQTLIFLRRQAVAQSD